MAGSPWTNQVVNLIILTEAVTGYSGLFAYSPSVAAGDLALSAAAAGGTDPEGNTYIPGFAVYATSGGYMQMTAGMLNITASGTQFTPATVTSNVAGALALSSGAATFGDQLAEILLESSQVFGQTYIELLASQTTATGNLTVDGTLTVVDEGATITGGLTVDFINGSNNTGDPSTNSTSQNGLSNGQISGTSGAASAGTAHTHGGGSYAVTSGQHTHDLQEHTHAI
jgi:hypothetical protein